MANTIEIKKLYYAPVKSFNFIEQNQCTIVIDGMPAFAELELAKQIISIAVAGQLQQIYNIFFLLNKLEVPNHSITKQALCKMSYCLLARSYVGRRPGI